MGCLGYMGVNFASSSYVFLKLEVKATIVTHVNLQAPLWFSKRGVTILSFQRNLMKTYHNEANTSGITKIASKIFLEFFEQSS